MRWLLLCLVGCAGCNQVFGLDETEMLVDDDDDGISDVTDNCLGLANPSQEDADDDGAGDACDGCDECLPCDRGADHDEDRDRVADNCDNCPAHVNNNQANRDGDDLGDACDASDLMERRLLFDGFVDLDRGWLESGSRWVVTDDDVGPQPPNVPNVTKILQHDSVLLSSGDRWVIEVGLVPLPLDRKLGVFVGDSGYCLLEHLAGGDWKLVASARTSAAFSATFDDPIRLRVTPAGPLGAQTIACTVPDVPTQVDNILELDYPLSIKLVTTYAGPQFRYIDVIGE